MFVKGTPEDTITEISNERVPDTNEMPIICLMVRENQKMVREKSGKHQGILWGLMAGHPDLVRTVDADGLVL